jgi:drug/metabolite transporter (DMT)-like permease
VYTVSRGLSLVIVWPLSVLIFAEPASGLAIGGACVLLVGLAIAGLERDVPRAAIGWAIATALCLAGYPLVYTVALGHGAMPPAVFAVAIGLAVPVQAAMQRVRPRAAVATVNARIVAAGFLCTASFLIFLWALRAAGAGAVLTLRNTSVVFAVGFGALVGDRPTARQIGGALLVAAGAAMVAA